MVFPVIGGDGKPTGYNISNSLRFNDGDGPDLSRAPSADGNRKTFTFSTWFKLGIPPYDGSSVDYDIFSANSTNNFNDNFRLRSDGQIQIQAIVSGSSNNGYNFRSNMLFRDPSAWYHLVVGIDTTQSTNSNGVKVYVNGSLITGTYHAYNQNISTSFNKDGSTMAIGHRQNDGGNHYDGYISETHFIDGTQLDSSYFGETNDNGVWIPKEYTGSYGTNGFFLEYQQTGTSANSSGMGADTSGNDNHFTPTNLQARSVVQDTPTNNFMTWNTLYTNSRGTFAEGNLQVTTNVQGSVPYGQVEFGNIHLNSGKWYWEVEVVQVGSGGSLGLGANERAYEGTYVNGHNNGGSSGNIRYNHSNGNVNNGSSTAVSGAATYTDDDTIGFAMDLDNNKMYIHKNGTYINSGDPAAGSNGITMTSAYSDYWTPWISKDDTSNNAKVYLNTGNPVLANDSGNADDNGYGDFEYDVPAGFYSICTKNLAEYG